MKASTPSLAPSSLMPGLHGVEPRNAADLHDDAHRGLVGCESARGEHGGESDARQQGASGCRKFHHNLTYLPLFAARANCGSIDPAALDQNVDPEFRIIRRQRTAIPAGGETASCLETCRGLRIGDRAGRRANPEFARQQDMFCRREVAFDPRAQRFPKGPAHLAHRLEDRGQAASLGRASRCSRRSRSARYRAACEGRARPASSARSAS